MRKLSRRELVKWGAVAAAVPGGRDILGFVSPSLSAFTSASESVLSSDATTDTLPSVPTLSCDDFAKAYVRTCLSNGLTGIRPAPNPLAPAQTVVSGFVRSHPIHLVECLAPAPYPLGADIRAFGESLRGNRGLLTIHRQALEMSSGELSTEMTFSPSAGCRIDLTVVQFMSRSVPALACQEILLRADSDVTAELVTSIDREGIPGKVFLDRAPGSKPELGLQALGFETDRSRLGVAVVVLPGKGITHAGDGVHRLRMSAGEGYQVRSIAAVVSDVYHHDPHLEAIRLCHWGQLLGFDQLQEQNRREWAELWKSRVKVNGDCEAQRALDAAFYYLHSSIHASCRMGVAPYGLSQYEQLGGHVFWDMDSWCLPPLLLTAPPLAKALLEFRVRGLEAARKRAAVFGYRGAQYPWEATRDGSEGTPSFVATGWSEQHVVPDVAIAFWEHQLATNDAEFLRMGTWPVLKNIAEWIESRGQFTERGFEIRAVMGVDEALPSTNNNSFMNLASKMAMEAAIACAQAVGAPVPPTWVRVRDSFYVPLDKGGHLVVPYDGALPGRGYSVGMLQFLFLHGQPVSLDLFRNTFEFEEKLRLVMPSDASNPCSAKAPGFSCSPFAACAAFLGDRRKAAELFTNSWKPYWVEPFGLIKEYQFFPDGDYVTGHGSLLQTAMLGFTGLRFSAGDWRRYHAALPEGWDRIEIDRVWVRGEPLRLVAEHGKPAVLTTEKGAPLPLPSAAEVSRARSRNANAFSLP